MINKFNLEKATASAKFTLAKRGTPNVRAQIVTALDVSGSARGLYDKGSIQEAFQTILPVAALLDLNKEIDAYTFASGDDYTTHVEPTANINNYSDYIKKNILNNASVPKWGGTSYSPVLKTALEDFEFYKKEKTGLFGFGGGAKKLSSNSKSGDPVICYFLTDGASDDEGNTTRLFKEMEAAGTNFYVLFVGIGNTRFTFLEEAADKFSNVGFVSAKDLSKFAQQEDLYEQLIPAELTEWLAKAR